MQADYATYASASVAFGSITTACWAFLARRLEKLPGPVTTLKRLLTHSQAIASVLAEMAQEIPAEFKARYPEHLRKCRERF